MSLLFHFMHDLLKQHEGAVDIIEDNARITIKQKAALSSLTNSSLHSSSHSTTRWLDETATPPMSANDLNLSNHSISLPTRKPSYDASSVSLKLAAFSNKENTEKKTKKIRRGKKPQRLSLPPLPPTRSKGDHTDETSSIPHSMKKQSPKKKRTKKHMKSPLKMDYEQPRKPKRQISPIMRSDNSVATLKTYLKRHGRSLSKTLGVGETKEEDAPRMPTRKVSKQPLRSVYSPERPPSKSMTSFQPKIFDDISLSPIDASSTFSLKLNKASSLSPTTPPLCSDSDRKFKLLQKPRGDWFSPLSKPKYSSEENRSIIDQSITAACDI
jgi:hypothetical protein